MMNSGAGNRPIISALPEAAQLAELQQECEQLKILVDITNAVLSTLQLDALLDQVSKVIRCYFDIDYIALDLFNHESGDVHSRAMRFPLHRDSVYSEANYPLAAIPAQRAVLAREPVLLTRQEALRELLAAHPQLSVLKDPQYHALCILPLYSSEHLIGILLLAHGEPSHQLEGQLPVLQQIAARIALSLDNALAYQEILRLKDRLANENRIMAEEISHYESFNEIIGESDAMSQVLEQVRIVASTDSTVLILGETGTGKELIARAIHNLSLRKKHKLVTMNCSAIPAGLLESDLFGHEKGTFTGATAQHLGRFELAHQGSLFLDEVGDMPLELQPKLLRVLQEREIERLGGHKIIPVDVRVIAATSCDLSQMIAEKRYRSDLFYRLNVFPIILPPLRERPEDIPLLARFFARKFAQRINRQIDSIAPQTLQHLINHPWPGNVRELQNVIERTVILSRGPELSLPLKDLQYGLSQPNPSGSSPAPAHAPIPIPAPVSGPHIEAAQDERERIIQVLKETNGIVAGPKGAAAKLGLKRTTLLSRMQRLGVSAKNYENTDS